MAGSKSKSARGLGAGPGRRAAPSRSRGAERPELLERWVTHTHHAHHDFSRDEAAEIRAALLAWYRTHRRRLPWRGDPPPYDGSTAGVNAAAGAGGRGGSQRRDDKKAKPDARKSQDQPTISRFFRAKPTPAPVEERSLHEEEKKEEEGRGNEASIISATAAVAVVPVTAYGVWVSEIMLQQTRVEAVIPYYLRWMESFPTVHHLAAATEDEVNSHWAGLGFYRRARLLHAGAKKVVEDCGGVLPNTVEGLLEISGIGPYTAGAVASIAYGRAVPVVDGNVCRVLSRLTGVANHIKAPALKDSELGWNLARQIVQAGNPGESAGRAAGENDAGDINQALMELGATYCAPSGTGTDARDPLRGFYRSTRIGRALATRLRDGSLGSVNEFVAGAEAARASGGGAAACRLCAPDGISTVIFDIANRVAAGGDEAQGDGAAAGHQCLPLAPPKKARRQEVLAVAAVCVQGSADEEARWLMVKRPNGGLLAGQWEFPSICLWNSAASAAAKVGDDKKVGSNRKKVVNSPTKVSQIKQKKAAPVPAIDAATRKDALDTYLLGISSAGEIPIVCDRVGVAEEPMEHIFSHVQHSMWLEYGKVSLSGRFADLPSQLSTLDGRRAEFMTEKEMAGVGITSAIQKILKVVKAVDHEPRKKASRKRRAPSLPAH